MSTKSKALVTKLTKLRDLLRKSGCGTGAGGFQPGNTCGRSAGGNSSEGSQRRRKRGKKRKRKGPDRGIGARTRAAQRKRAGRHNTSRRKWREELSKPGGSPEGRALYRSHAEERKDLADSFKAERKAQAKEKQSDFKATAKDIKGERKELAKDQHKERVGLKKEQARELDKADKTAAKEHAKLDAKYEAAKASGKNPEKLEQAYQERKREIDASHAETRGDLEAEHRQARVDMKLTQREERALARGEHRDSIESIRNDHRAVTNDQHTDQREQIYDLKTSHRAERAELVREIRDEGWKAFEFVDVKAAPDIASVPTAQAILDAALEASGKKAGWQSDSLSDREALDLLHDVRLEARRWFRSEAQAVRDELDSLTEKGLTGRAKATVKAFFEKARKYVRELVVAGVLAIAGPDRPFLDDPLIAAAIDTQVEGQFGYLDQFEAAAQSGERPVDGRFVSDAESYGASAWSTTQNIIREVAEKRKVFNHEKREHIGPRHPPDCPCATCSRMEFLHWRPIGTLNQIGESECLNNCHCSFFFAIELDGENTIEWEAGRGPLFKPAFGDTPSMPYRR